MNLGRRLVEAAYVWAFWTVLSFIFIRPSKQAAIELSVAIGLLVLLCLIVILALSLIYRSLQRLSNSLSRKDIH